jgi:hypothetical protein
LVIAFWAGMMTALVRVEVYPPPPMLQSYSTERVLRKVFSNPEPVRLNVYYNENHIGFFKISIEPVKPADDTVGGSVAGPDAGSYKVTSELRVWVTFGMPSQLLVKGESVFDKKLELDSFNFVTSIGDRRVGNGHVSDGHIDITGDDRSKKVHVKFDVSGFRDERTLDFDQIKGAGLASAFGLPMMANFSSIISGLPGSFTASGGGAHSLPTTTTYRDRLEVAGNQQRVYLVDSKINDETWTKLWVDDAGQVLKVTTSLGLEMRSDMALGTVGTGDAMNRGMHRRHHWD